MVKPLLGTILAAALLAAPLVAAPSPAEQQVTEAIKAPGATVVHLWAPWCGNCKAELKSGGWTKMVKDNPEVKFYFVSVWNSGEDGRALLASHEHLAATERHHPGRPRSAWSGQDYAICRAAGELDPVDLDL